MNETEKTPTDPERPPERPEEEQQERSSKLGIAPLLAGAAAIVVAIVVAIVLIGGSDDGNDSEEASNSDGFPPNVVTDSDLQTQEEGSPGRGLLEWWQAFQFQDVDGVISLTSPDTLDTIGENNLEELVKTRGQGLQGVEVLGATEDGDTASVRVGLLQFVPEKKGDPPPEEPTGSTPDTFAMQQEGGEWLFAATDYLEPQVEAMETAEAEAQEQQGEEQAPEE